MMRLPALAALALTLTLPFASSRAMAQGAMALTPPTLAAVSTDAQRPAGVEEVPPPPTPSPMVAPATVAPEASAPDGARVIELRERIARERRALEGIQDGIPLGLMIGGWALTAGGGLTALVAGVGANGDTLIGGLVVGGVGLVTAIANLIWWRVTRHQIASRQRVIGELEQELHFHLQPGPARGGAPAYLGASYTLRY